MSWRPLLQSWLRHQAERGLSLATLKLRSLALRYWEAFCGRQSLAPGQVTAEHLERFLQERPVALPTRNGYITSLRQFFGWLLSRGHLLQNPSLGLYSPRLPEPSFPVLSRAQVERLMGAPDPFTPEGMRDRAILELFYSTAVRLGECQALDLGDLDLAEGTLWVRRGKGGLGRLLPVGDQLAPLLGEYLRLGRPNLFPVPGNPALFLSRYGGRLSRPGYGKGLHRLAHRAGLEVRVTPHLLRHSCALHLLEGGAPLEAVSTLLGHRQLRSTQPYTRLSPEAVAREHRRTHPRATREGRA